MYYVITLLASCYIIDLLHWEWGILLCYCHAVTRLVVIT